MAFEITKTELLWPGKYDEDGKRREPPLASLPFQVVERVNESRATREAQKRRDLTLFDLWKGGDEGDTFEEGWRNKLIWGDNLLVMSSLLEQFAGGIDLIYIDPPFATGADFSFTTEIGETGQDLFKEQSLIEDKAYRDTWGRGTGSYLSMLHDRLALCRNLLGDNGSIFVHCDWHVGHLIRNLLDDVFGADCFVNEVVWCYRSGGASRTRFARKHDTLLFYSKTASYTFNPQHVPYVMGGIMHDEKGPYQIQYGKRVDFNPEGALMPDWWEVSAVSSVSHERLPFPTQKPESLLERVIKGTSNEGDLVADFFCGSGTSLAVAEKLGRRWIGCDLGRWAMHVTRKRMLGIEECKPFEVLNLGKYERQYWQVATFGEDLDEDGSIALYEYIAFILKLYGATALSGMGNLHGRVGKAFVHVGAVDAPVTIQEIAEAIEECRTLKGSELHVLGWEWEMGVNDLMVEQARKEKVKLQLRQIPREVMETQAATKGDIRFFELAYVNFEVKPLRTKRQFQVLLQDFAIPNPELVPDDVRSKVKKWSDYVDYWAVDWEFREDTFMQGWVTYRTRKDRSLELKSDPHSYGDTGDYAVMVKVIDIFGNDTSKVVRVQVK